MMKKRIQSMLYAMLLLIAPLSIIGQVTIGSLNKPNQGAILDLKQHADGISTAGLAMPRVNLTNVNELYPMFLDSVGKHTSEYENNKSNYKAEHIGLVVYNINRCLNNKGDDNGMYIWGGESWNSIMPETNYGAGVGTVSDNDGNTYTTMDYGSKAGVWMTENLRTTKYPDGSPITESYKKSEHKKSYYYPAPSNDADYQYSGDPEKDGMKFRDNPQYGLLYTFEAMVNDEKILVTTPPGQPPVASEENDPNEAKIRGICPSGFYLPRDYDWNLLEEEIANSSTKYTYDQTEVTPWNNNWNLIATGGTERGDHALAMRVPCEMNRTQIAKIEGKSLSNKYGGFYVWLTGYIAGTSAVATSDGTYFWTTSTLGGNMSMNAYTRMVTQSDQVVKAGGGTYLSVRCKKL